MKRWEVAQESEKAYWEESFKDEPAFREMCLKFYPVYKDFLNKNNINTSEMNVIDIGSGAYGICSVINGRYKAILDPLMNYFETKVPLEFYNERNIHTINGVGEHLPFPNESYDLICCINTLDHAIEPEKIIQEANRCLKNGGYLLLSANHYDYPIVFYREILETLGMGDLCHPNTYHLDDIQEMLENHRFKIINYKIGDVKESKQKIEEVGGQTKVSFKERIIRAAKSKGWWYVFKQMLVTPGHLIVNKLFTTYPDSIFLCRKIK